MDLLFDSPELFFFLTVMKEQRQNKQSSGFSLQAAGNISAFYSRVYLLDRFTIPLSDKRLSKVIGR